MGASKKPKRILSRTAKFMDESALRRAFSKALARFTMEKLQEER